MYIPRQRSLKCLWYKDLHHAWYREENLDVGVCACRARLRSSADRLARCAAAEGLLLQPISPKDRRPDSSAICLQYGNNQIVPSPEKVEDESKGRSIEVHGVVGEYWQSNKFMLAFLTLSQDYLT